MSRKFWDGIETVSNGWALQFSIYCSDRYKLLQGWLFAVREIENRAQASYRYML